MPKSKGISIIRACLMTAFASTVFAPALFADFLESSPFLPPPNGVYTLPNACIAVVCLENIQLSDFVTTNSQIVGGNQVTQSNVDLTAAVYQDVGGNPGPFISPLVMTGQVDITYFSKNTLSQTGSFDALITSLNLSGTFTGSHTADAMLNPNHQSTGETSITEIPGPPQEFAVNSFFDIFAELSIDGGPFVPGPERTANLTPEPGYYVPMGVGLAALGMLRYAKAKRRPARLAA